MILEEKTYHFIKELNKFDYEIEGADFFRKVIFKDLKEKWKYIHITKYQDTYYIYHINGELGTLEVETRKSVKIIHPDPFSQSRPFYPDEPLIKKWADMITFAGKWLKLLFCEALPTSVVQFK